jgi:hypothetical protein
MAVVYESLIRFITYTLIFSAIILILYFLKSSKRLEEWERRIFMVVLFYVVHEISFFLEEPFIYQLTGMLFVVGLVYSLFYVFSFEMKIKMAETKIKDAEEERKKFLQGLEEIRGIKEIREKLKK